MDHEIFEAELKILREFIDFVNRQVGVYCDCLASFQGNHARVERQVARLNIPMEKKYEKGQTVIVSASVEDPTRPDVIIHRIIKAEDFLVTNSEQGFNEQQICWSIIVFMFAYWDEEIRPKIAAARGVKPNDVRVDALGDLRLLRGSIVHNGGVIRPTDYLRLKVLGEVCESGSIISPSHDQMHKIFIKIKNAIASLMMTHIGHLPDAPDSKTIVGVAIQYVSGN